MNMGYYKSKTDKNLNDKFMRLINFHKSLGPIDYYFDSKKNPKSFSYICDQTVKKIRNIFKKDVNVS